MRPAELLYQKIRVKAPLISAFKKFPDWRASVEQALAGDEAWAAASERTKARLLGAMWSDGTGFGASRFNKRRLNTPWADVSASVREGVARVSCPACGQFHEHVPADGKRYASCGLTRYFLTLLPASSEHPSAGAAGAPVYRITLS